VIDPSARTDGYPSPIVNLTGEHVALGPQRRELVPIYQRWLNDFAVIAPLGASLRPMTEEAELRLYEETSIGQHQAWFTLYEIPALRPIGITGLRDIEPLHRSAEFVIFIGEKECWGKGYGTETARLILDHGFTALGLHNIMLQVYSNNERGIRAYRRAGFREIGRRRRAFRLAGDTYDVIYMDCLSTER
jgi:RimJ/RimL family protein N-acetyltransferase